MPAPKSILKFALTAALALLYIGDWAAVRLRALHATAIFLYETITVPRVLAIPQKNGKTDYEIDELNRQETITCVHSLFPHSGFNPCWYVKRKAMQPIPM